MSRQLNVPVEEFIVPWKPFVYQGKTFGGVTNNNRRSAAFHIPKPIPRRFQSLEEITPTEAHLSLLYKEMQGQGFDIDRKLVLFFPRGRRRDRARNWTVKYYHKLHKSLSQKFPDYLAAFAGSSEGSIIKGDLVPKGCLNLVEINRTDQMLNIHVAAMSRSAVAIGPASGILHVASYAGLPIVTTVGSKTHKKYPNRFTRDCNPFRIPSIVLPGDDVPLGHIRSAMYEAIQNADRN